MIVLVLILKRLYAPLVGAEVGSEILSQFLTLIRDMTSVISAPLREAILRQSDRGEGSRARDL